MVLGLRKWARALVAGSSILGSALTSCMDRPVCADCVPDTKSVFLQRVPTGRVDKIDLVFMIDNSASMADKQALLSQAVPSLVNRFVRPLCVDAAGVPNGQQATNGVCASGVPEFPAMEDIHVAVINSSLGTNGGQPCRRLADNITPDPASDDHAWLLPIAHPELNLTSWANSGFLAWDPTQKRNTPPGTSGSDTLSHDFQDMVDAVGERGCGYEASLEAWYRFLIAPDPPQSFQETEQGIGVPVGLDEALLQQRDRFLRSDSLVVILMLSDENDCSFRSQTVAPLLSRQSRDWNFWRASTACATNPADPCCRSCKSGEASPPPGCLPLEQDPQCGPDRMNPNRYTPLEDPQNLRCFDHKRRFGVDLLEPTDKYVRGLTADTVLDRDGNAQQNPLFAPRHGKPAREKNLVYLAGIVGVPWQDIATDDSLTGPGLRYLDAKELAERGRWDVILGDPLAGKKPSDPHMIESVDVRSGNHPFVSNAAIQPSPTAAPTADAISGHEQQPPQRDDLQYACTFELPEPRPCVGGDCGDCDAASIRAGRPLCKPPAGGQPDGRQYYAKAYPGLRQLQVLKGIGEQGIVASVCPKVVRSADPSADPSFGYNPAVNALVDRLKAPLANQCLARPPAIDSDGTLSCAVVEAGFGDACDCSKPGRGPVEPSLLGGVRHNLAQSKLCGGELGPPCTEVCACAIVETQGPALDACRNAADPGGQAPGYCYVEPSAGRGAPELVQGCPESRKRLLRFVGPDTPTNGSIAFMACIGADTSSAP